jgi:hypothetical protein
MHMVFKLIRLHSDPMPYLLLLLVLGYTDKHQHGRDSHVRVSISASYDHLPFSYAKL